MNGRGVRLMLHEQAKSMLIEASLPSYDVMG